MHFGSRLVGYVVGISGADLNTLFLAKTEDGGASWRLSTVRDFTQGFGTPPYETQSIFFEDESNGFLNQGHYQSSQPYRTSDGGRTARDKFVSTWRNVQGQRSHHAKIAPRWRGRLD
jgi:hypothetical protein